MPSKQRETNGFSPGLQKKQHPTDRVRARVSQQPRLGRRGEEEKNRCHLSSIQSRENKGDSHCHCLRLQLIITSTSKAVACAVISTAGNVTTRPTAQTTTSARPGAPGPCWGERAGRRRVTDKRSYREKQQEDKRALGSFDDPRLLYLLQTSTRLLSSDRKAEGNPAQLPPQRCPFPRMT